jgi:5'-nucleotidase
VAVAPAPVKALPPIHLTLVGTNDLHGYVLPQTETVGTASLRAGGLATFAAYLKILRGENPGGVLLVDGGDLFQGTLVSNLSEGAVVVDAYNRLAYDATAIGNHEFDYGPVGPAFMALRPDQDPVGALRARIAQAHFPFLGANVFEKGSDAHPAWLTNDGTLLVERNGVKVGIIGMSTPLTPGVTVAMNVAALRFAPLATVAIAAAAKLRERGAELVIVTMHAGGRCGDTAHHEDLSSCDVDTAEVFEMMKAVPAGTLDAVVAGHTHAPIAQFVNGTPVIESWAQGRYFGVVDFYLDPTTHQVLTGQTAMQPPVPLCETYDAQAKSCDPRQLKGKTLSVVPALFHGQPIVPDAELGALLEPAQQRVAELQARPLGVEVKEPLTRRYEEEGALGDVLTDALRKLAKVDVVLLNPGGIRADLPKGPLTYGAVYEVVPFDNQLAVLTLTGVELKQVLSAFFASRRGMLQLSGAEVTVSKCITPDRLKGFTVAGKPVDPRRVYRLATTDFLARGGEGLAPTLKALDPKKIDLGDARAGNLREELINFWEHERQPLVAPKPGRVKLVDEPCPTP